MKFHILRNLEFVGIVIGYVQGTDICNILVGSVGPAPVNRCNSLKFEFYMLPTLVGGCHELLNVLRPFP